jgi:hypothetical protein
MIVNGGGWSNVLGWPQQQGKTAKPLKSTHLAGFCGQIHVISGKISKLDFATRTGAVQNASPWNVWPL